MIDAIMFTLIVVVAGFSVGMMLFAIVDLLTHLWGKDE
jgi:uncharacterized membrane protein YuzA (DUF378 family)